MKKVVFGLVCILFTSKLLAQDCSHYLYFQKDKTIEMSSFDKKGTLRNKSISKVTDVNTSGGTTTADVAVTIYDKNDKTMGTSNATYKCTGNSILVQMTFNMPDKNGKSQETNTQMNLKSNSGGFAEYPSNMHVGDHLKDVTTQMGMGNMAMTAHITDRMVLAKESVTTPAGTWECFKISYKTSIERPNMTGGPGADSVNSLMSAMSKLHIKLPGSTAIETTLWYATDFGPVKTETSNGSITELTAIK